jgi:hypothetical protein
LRLEYPGAVYYVTARGNAGQRIFLDDEDREAFFATLGAVVARFHRSDWEDNARRNGWEG